MAKIFKPIIDLLSSFGLSVVILLLLFLLTVLGTLEHGMFGLSLHEAQKKYFDSIFLVHHIGPVAIPLPGTQLLLWLLLLNLIVGGMVRLRKRKSTIGILITHIGIAFMLIAGWVKLYHSDDGHLTLFEGERHAQFQSYYTWEIAISHVLPDGQVQEHVIPDDDFTDVRQGYTQTYVSDELPFDLELQDYMANSTPRPKGPMVDVDVPVVDLFYLQELPMSAEAEHNIAGVYATVIEKSSGTRKPGILWGFALDESSTARNPFVTEVGGTTYAIELRHTRYPLPFAIHLDKFSAEFHPGTPMASNFESEVTRLDGDVEQPVVIRMNEPLRDGNYVLFQSQYGRGRVRPGQPMYSVFSVVRNPSDQWPLYSCVIIALGLLIHFSSMLLRYARAEQRRAAA